MGEQETKSHLIATTQALLEQGVDPDRLTVRQIAQEAGVGLGLINYHFGTKDNLLFEAIGANMQEVAAEMYQPENYAHFPPRERLRELLQRTGEIGMRYPKLFDVGIRHSLVRGDVSIVQMVLPLLREIYGTQKDELTLRMIAFQLITSIQAAFLQREHLGLYMGINVNNPAGREQLIDILIDNLLGKVGE